MPVRLTLVTPAFNEGANLEAFHEHVLRALGEADIEWSWIIVDDHSGDDTFATAGRLAAADPRVRAVRLSRNSGSHTAITCGLHLADGDAVAVLAADLQDPPSLLPRLLERWRAGAQVVWAARRSQPGAAAHGGFASVYYRLIRRVKGLEGMPRQGADAFLLDREVVEGFRRFPERHTSVLALLTWVGFRQEAIEYDKAPRAAGRSGWTVARKLKLVGDSLAAFTAAPLRLVSALGAALLVGAAGAAWAPPAGAPAWLLAAVLGVAGLQCLALGVIGEYLWRALEEARGRPAYLIEARAGRWEPSE